MIGDTVADQPRSGLIYNATGVSPMAATSNSDSESRKVGAIGCVVLVAIIFFISLIGASCSSDPSTPPPPPDIPDQQGAARPDSPATQQAETAYLEDLQERGVPMTTKTTLNGYATCLILRFGTSVDSANSQAQSSFGLTPDQATAFVDAAQRDLCSHIH
ncbi:DUF732 domain-containing protein [Pseudonocardia sp. Cha107L01]|uniref:DUF732 domain-containing protein n=1 Tax=Pseudonocardia sp. Cha107L01 TaxID=3457576 RepID=UPI00403EBD8D